MSLLFIGVTAKSQILISLLLGDKLNAPGVEFGMTGGYNWSEINGMDANKALSTFNLGFYFDLRIKEPFCINTGLLMKSKMGLDDLTVSDLYFLNAIVYDEAGDYSQSISYFILPVLLKYKLENNLYFEAGPSLDG